MSNPTLTALRATTLVATSDNGHATGPGMEADIDFVASECLCSGMDLLTALQCDNADAVAQNLGWRSAVDLMVFRSDGPETARRPQ